MLKSLGQAQLWGLSVRATHFLGGSGKVLGIGVTGSSLSVRRCEVVDGRPFPLSETVYNTFVFGGRSVVSEHIGYYTDRKGNDIVLGKNW